MAKLAYGNREYTTIMAMHKYACAKDELCGALCKLNRADISDDTVRITACDGHVLAMADIKKEKIDFFEKRFGTTFTSLFNSPEDIYPDVYKVIPSDCVAIDKERGYNAFDLEKLAGIQKILRAWTEEKGSRIIFQFSGPKDLQPSFLIKDGLFLLAMPLRTRGEFSEDLFQEKSKEISQFMAIGCKDKTFEFKINTQEAIA